MAIRISLFNHKGGVSKTTTTFNLGWKLSGSGKKVLIVDMDPQCNLTGMVLGSHDPEKLTSFYKDTSNSSIYKALVPVFESRPVQLTPADCIRVHGASGLYLLPGHIGISEFEVALGVAQELTSSFTPLQQLPGSISHLLDITAKKYKIDYIIVDLSPSLSSLNQNVLMTSDYFILPTTPDVFSVMAINSLSRTFGRWRQWADRASSTPILQQSAYPFPTTTCNFLGFIVQNFRPRAGKPAKAFKEWVDEIRRVVNSSLIPVLRSNNMLLKNALYEKSGVLNDGYCLAEIPDFNSLIARSQKLRKPVFLLESSDLARGGAVTSQMEAQRDRLNSVFEALKNKVITMTKHE